MVSGLEGFHCIWFIKEHIWAFVTALGEGVTYPLKYVHAHTPYHHPTHLTFPDFVGKDYFGIHTTDEFYTDVPLCKHGNVNSPYYSTGPGDPYSYITKYSLLQEILWIHSHAASTVTDLPHMHICFVILFISLNPSLLALICHVKITYPRPPSCTVTSRPCHVTVHVNKSVVSLYPVISW